MAFAPTGGYDSTFAASGYPIPEPHVPAIPFPGGAAPPIMQEGTLVPAEGADPPVRIKAYARLEFAEGFDFYIKTLGVTIGRRPPMATGLAASSSLKPSRPTSSPHLSPILRPTSATRSTSPGEDEEAVGSDALVAPPLDPPPAYSIASPGADAIHVDVDLGPIKAVSRDHARLYYDYGAAAWALEVRGRNGVVVEGRWRARGEKSHFT